MEIEKVMKRGVAVLFIVILFTFYVKSGSYRQIDRLAGYLQQGDSAQMESLESEFAANLWKQQELIEINGAMARKLNMHGYYSDMKMYITEDDYIVSASPYTSTDYEFEQTVAFRDFLESNGINLLYVNQPTKYMDDDVFLQFGVETYSNRNMDQFIRRLKYANVNVIDLRDNIVEDKLEVQDLFYRTDHHWTTSAGLWGTQIIAQGLNEMCGYNIDASIYDMSNYSVMEWEECWLGEQGRKISESYIGLDDYVEIKPTFETSFSFKNWDGTTWDGTFENFIDEGVYSTTNNVYTNPSWHYSYQIRDCINNNVADGKILILADSYASVTEPFLALGVHEVDTVVLRDCDDDFNLHDYILSNNYDTVIVAYAQFMLGAHDDVSSANYNMFTFE